ncbi:hypothetical protein HRU45_04720 [Candidatus Dependentiae bacterium]|nr:hypothetical protein [Candidatus Dependentiae bacterium]
MMTTSFQGPVIEAIAGYLGLPNQKTLNDHRDFVNSVAWNPDGTQLASGSSDETIKIWNPHAGILLHTLNGHTDWVRSVAWNPDGTQLASGSYDRTIKIWNIDKERLITTIVNEVKKELTIG